MLIKIIRVQITYIKQKKLFLNVVLSLMIKWYRRKIASKNAIHIYKKKNGGGKKNVESFNSALIR